jgi:hypothetical protein
MTLGPTGLFRVSTLALLAFGSVAHADTTAIDIPSAPALGKVAAGTAASTFTVNGSTGAVALASGNAVRFNSPGTISTPTVSVTCNGNVAARTVTVTVTSTGSGRANITNFTRTNTGGIGTFGGATTGSPLIFTIQFPSGGGANTATFKLGMTVQIATTGTTGVRSLPYTVATSRP